MADGESHSATTPRRVAVTGATGYIGSRLVAQLRTGGLETVALTRSPVAADAGPRRVYDVAAGPSPDLLDDVDVLVHCAWDLTAVKPAAVWEVNVLGTERLLDLARRAGVGRIVFVSSMSAYDGTRQLYGRSKLAAERVAFDNGGVVARLGLVYGPHWGGMAGSLRKMVSLPVTPLVGAGAHQFTVHEDDAIAALVRLATASSAPAVPLGIAHPEPVVFRDLLEAIARAAGTHPRFVPFPWQVLYAGLRVGEVLHLPLPFRAESLLGLVRPAPSVPNADVVASLGIALRSFALP